MATATDQKTEKVKVSVYLRRDTWERLWDGRKTDQTLSDTTQEALDRLFEEKDSRSRRRRAAR